MRADGSNYDAKGLPDSILPIISEMPSIEKLNVTAEGDLAVATYFVNVDQTRDGVLVEAYAPRLSVFRKDGERWLMVAHSNFAALMQ
jgi:ketosteroid isomerase-like protein